MHVLFEGRHENSIRCMGFAFHKVQWWHVQNQLHEIVPKIMQISWFLTDLFQKYKRTFLLEQCSTWCGSSLSILRNLGRQLGGSHSGGAPHIILIKLCSWFRLNTSLLAVTPPCYWCHCHWLLLGHVAALARCGLLLQMSWCSVVRLSACVRACVRVCVCQSVGCCKTAEPTQTQLDPRNHLLHIWGLCPPTGRAVTFEFPRTLSASSQSSHAKNQLDSSSSFDRTPTWDRHGQTHGHRYSTALA